MARTTIETIHTHPSYGWKNIMYLAAQPWAVVEMKAGGEIVRVIERYEGQRAANMKRRAVMKEEA